MKIASITDPLTANGMKLAGIEIAHKVEDAKEAEKIFEEMINKDDIGVIIITEQLAKEMDERVASTGSKISRVLLLRVDGAWQIHSSKKHKKAICIR